MGSIISALKSLVQLYLQRLLRRKAAPDPLSCLLMQHTLKGETVYWCGSQVWHQLPRAANITSRSFESLLQSEGDIPLCRALCSVMCVSVGGKTSPLAKQASLQAEKLPLDSSRCVCV